MNTPGNRAEINEDHSIVDRLMETDEIFPKKISQ